MARSRGSIRTGGARERSAAREGITYKVLVTPRSFGEGSRRPLEILEQGQCEVVRNTRGRQFTEEELVQAIADVDGLIVGLDPVTRRVIQAGPRLRVISKHGVGVDNIDLSAAVQRGVIVTNTPGVSSHAVADLALGLMLCVAREIPRNAAIARQGGKKGTMGRELHAKTLGIVGFGRIGREVARRARGFDMTILYADQVRQQAAEEGLAAHFVPLEELLRRSDFVSLHLPLVPATQNLISEGLLRLMKPQACLVNTSRAGIVDEGALARALLAGNLAAAAVDVYRDDSPLLGLENVVCLPHVGAYTFESVENMGAVSAENCVRVLQGREPRFRVTEGG